MWLMGNLAHVWRAIQQYTSEGLGKHIAVDPGI